MNILPVLILMSSRTHCLCELGGRLERTILERQDREGWGARVIDRLSTDLREAFP